MRKLLSTLAILTLCGLSHGALAAAERVTICHKNVQTASIAAPALSAHLQHGDTEGPCGEDSQPAETMTGVVMMRCEAQQGDGVLVVSASSSPPPAIDMDIVPGESDCSVILGALLDANYGLRTVNSGSAEDDGSLHLYTDYLLLGKVPAAQ